jgi:HEAT repeat protein
VEVIERLSDARADVVLHAAQELGKRGYSSRAITVLENLLDPAPDLRLRALNELVFVPGLDARPWLWRVSGDADVRVRRAAVSMLITTGDAQVLRRLRELEANETDAVILQIIRQARRP